MNIRLLLVQGKPAGKSLLFGPGKYLLGRGEECHVRFKSDWVSRQHCLLRVLTDQASVRDLGSRNGTLVNGQLVDQERFLHQGDQIQVGSVVFEVHLDSEPGPTPTPAEPVKEIFRSSTGEGSSKPPPLDSTVLPPFLSHDDE